MTRDQRVVAGTDGVVAVERDRHGIPRVRASSVGDLFVGQGFATATDRLGQMEWDRRRGRGRTAELHGTPANVVTDSVHRRLRLVDHARAGYAALGEETQAVLDAYVAGVNTAAAEVETPRQLAAVGAAVEPWEPWDPVLVFLVRHVTFATWQTKLWNARVLTTLGPDAVAAFGREGRRGTAPLIVPSGAEVALEDVAAAAALDPATAAVVAEHLAPLGLGTSGSNAWAVHGSRTASGSPLVAGDPHRALEVPNVYYQVHLVGPGIDASGLSFVGVPGIQHFAQTDAVAWAVTNAMADYQDLFVERLPEAVVDRRVETVAVRGGEPVAVECLVTERGPVVVGGTEQGVGLALATTGLDEPGGSLRTILPFLRARSVDDLEEALADWVEPANNVVCADVAGRVAYRTAGRIPVRHQANQHLPVPGWDDTFAWRGVVPFADLPTERDAPLVVTANQRIAEGAVGAALAPDYALPARAVRIRARLEAIDGGHTVEDQRRIHTDDVWLPGVALARRLEARGLAPELTGWDGRLPADSEVAALVVRTFGHLVRRVAAALPPALRTNPFARWEPPGTTYPVEMRVADGLSALLDGGDDELVPGLRWVDHLADAVGAARAEPPARWGDLHGLLPQAALRGADPDLDAAMAIASPPLGGGRDCVFATNQIDGLLTQTYIGSTARYVWDLADRAGSRWIVPLGASGEPDSPHFSDQLPLWARGDLVPVIDEPVTTTTLRPR